jgi:ribosomal-protein-alanine N-acetyltransferase
MVNKLNFNPFPELRTERLRLRRLIADDFRTISELRSDPLVNKFIKRDPATADHKGAKAFIERIDKGINDNFSIMWAICIPERSDLVGTICLWNFSEDKFSAEMGYELIPAFTGKGLMSDAMHAVIGFARNDLHLKRVEAFTHLKNLRSVRVLQKNGFVLDPERRDEDVEMNRIYVLDLI